MQMVTYAAVFLADYALAGISLVVFSAETDSVCKRNLSDRKSG